VVETDLAGEALEIRERQAVEAELCGPYSQLFDRACTVAQGKVAFYVKRNKHGKNTFLSTRKYGRPESLIIPQDRAPGHQVTPDCCEQREEHYGVDKNTGAQISLTIVLYVGRYMLLSGGGEKGLFHRG
jgi:hypothetical protein